jgi:ABC-type antimicrobial peptide transport system permease subunit
MLFIGFSLSDIFYNINAAEYARASQGSDMLISTGENGETFSRARVDSLLDDDEVVRKEYFLKFRTVMKTQTDSKVVLAEVTDLADYLDAHNLKYVERWGGDPNIIDDNPHIQYYPVIIGAGFAKSAGLVAGNNVELYLPTYDMYVKLVVLYVAENTGIFSLEDGINILLDFSAAGSEGLVNAVYLKFSDADLYAQYENAFNESFPALKVEEGDRTTYATQIASNNTLLFAAGLIFIVAVMMLIQLASYLVISRKRMSEMTIFKAAGATPMQTAIVMLLEVMLYALVGVLIGLITGRLIMQIAGQALLGSASEILTYPFWKYLVSALIAIFVSLLACLAPIIGTAKRSMRELVAGSQRLVRKTNPVAFIASVVIITGLAITIKFLSGIAVVIVSAILVVTSVLVIYFATQPVLTFIGFVLRKIKAGSAFGLGAHTPPRNKSLQSITILLTTVIAFTFVVISVIDMVKIAVIPYNTRFQSDYVLVTLEKRDIPGYDQVRDTITLINGVEQVGYLNVGTLLTPGGSVDDEDSYINVYGARDFNSVAMACPGGLSKDTQTLWNATEHPAIINSELMIKNKWKIGDIITFDAQAEDFAKYDFTFLIVGVDYTSTEYDRVAYVKISDFDMMTDAATFLVEIEQGLSPEAENLLFLEVRDVAENIGSISGKAGHIYALRYNEWAYAGVADTAEGVSALLGLLQVAIFLISLLGLINISVVAIYDRHREYIIYGLCGMARGDYTAFSLSESTTVGLGGASIGYALLLVINTLLPTMGALVGKYLDYGTLSLPGFIIAVVSCIAFMLIWIIGTTIINRKNVRLSAINERLT